MAKELGSRYPISADCPGCGGTTYRTVAPDTQIAFAKDRVCKECGVRYTPPTPAWARLLFGVLAVVSLLGGSFMAYWAYTSYDPPWYKGFGAGVIWAVMGTGAFAYKALSKG